MKFDLSLSPAYTYSFYKKGICGALLSLIWLEIQDLLGSFYSKFEAAKKEVNADLAAFAEDVANGLENGTLSEEQETAEYLILLSEKCMETTPPRFWDDCEGVVQILTVRLQKSQRECMKQLLTRMLFILTRCNRILQFHKDSDPINEESLTRFQQCIESVPTFDRKWDLSSQNNYFDINNFVEHDSHLKHDAEDFNKVMGKCVVIVALLLFNYQIIKYFAVNYHMPFLFFPDICHFNQEPHNFV